MFMGRNHQVKFRTCIADIRHAGIRDAAFITDAGMIHTDQHIIFSLNGVNDLPCFLKHIRDGTVRKIFFIPASDVMGSHSNDGNPDSAAFENRITRRQRGPIRQIYISGQGQRIEIRDGFPDRRNPEIVFMVSGHPDIAVKLIECLNHRMNRIIQKQFGRVVLNQITSIDIDRLFGAVRVQRFGKLRHASAGIFLINRVVPRNHLPVQIACRKDPDDCFVFVHNVTGSFCNSFCP